MKIMKKTITTLAFAATSPIAFGAAGIYDSFIFTTTNGTSPAFYYGLGGGTAFDGADLGTFDRDAGDTLQFGGQQKSFKNNSTDVTAHTLHYSINGGSFQTVALNFQWNNGDAGAPAGLNNGGDQQWGGDVTGSNASFTVSSDVIAGLANGTYTVDVFSSITTNGVNAAGTINNDNGGSNYTATFTVVPEPSSAALLGLGGLALILRRRK